MMRDVDPAWKLGGTSGDIKELPEAAKKASCPFSSLKSHPSGICWGDAASRFPSLEETRTGETRGGRESETMPSYPQTALFSPLPFLLPPLPPPLFVPYSIRRSPGVLGSRKYRLSYSFEGAENRYGAFCARATGEIPNRCRRSFSRAPCLALARLAAHGPPFGGGGVSK